MNKVPVIIVAGVFLVLGTAVCVFTANSARAALANHVVVNEVHIDSQSGTGGSEDDWVELHNPTASLVSLDGWSLQKFSSSGSTLYNQALSGTIPAGSYFLVVRDGGSTMQSLKDMADLLASDSFSLAANNIVYLVNDSINITPSSPTPNIVDFVGFGSANYYEGAAAAPNVSEEKSISRVPNGEDTDENSVDFKLQNIPSPENSSFQPGQDVGGTVLLTITPGNEPVQDIGPDSANIVFQVNSNGSALVEYGQDDTYGSTAVAAAVVENTTIIVNLSGLECDTAYHFRVTAENIAGNDSDISADAVFNTLPCGISLDALTMTKSAAKANDTYTEGWEWQFDITVWNLNETILKMKFNSWSGPDVLDAGGNMRFSTDNGASWFGITDNDAYPALGADISGIDINVTDPGRQVTVLVQMKVPAYTLTGYYNSSYGILTE